MNLNDRTFQALSTRQAPFEQGGSDNLLYTIDYAAVIQPSTISTSTWEADGVIIANKANTTTTASARLTGSAGTYTVKNVITTAIGDTYQRTIKLHIVGGKETADYE